MAGGNRAPANKPRTAGGHGASESECPGVAAEGRGVAGRPADSPLWQMRADLLRAFAHPVRLRILALLAGGERCVCEVYPTLRCERTAASKHLAILRRAGVVDCRKDGLRVIYWLSNPRLAELERLVDELLKNRLGEALSNARTALNGLGGGPGGGRPAAECDALRSGGVSS